jgi:hypothetical protein
VLPLDRRSVAGEVERGVVIFRSAQTDTDMALVCTPRVVE